MKRILFVIISLGLLACEKSTEWPIEPTDSDIIAVSGGITNETKAHCINITKLARELNGVAEPISGAQVTISDGTNTWILTESDSLLGWYYTDSTVSGTPGKTYTLSIKTKTNEYTASDYMPSSVWFAPLKYSLGNDDSLFQITWVASAYHPATPAMYEILIDWSTVPGYEDSLSGDCRARTYFFTLTSIDVCELNHPEYERIFFPEGALITERRYSVSPAHEEYIRSLLIETNWNGGLFNATTANLPTNISNGAVGFFYAGAVNQITLNVVQ